MTAYHGGKQRIGKQLAEIIVDESIDIAEEEGFEIKGYCEPFCGMLGVYRHIPELFEEEGFDDLNYLAGDFNTSVIKMWKSAQKGWKPPYKASKEEYENLKKTYRSSARRGFVGHACSYGGIYLSSYQASKCKSLPHASQTVKRIAEDLHDVKFTAGDYTFFSNLKGYVIYCDPPYTNDKGKNNSYYDEGKKLLRFNHLKFWEWCDRVSEHNLVFVTEFKAPKGTKLIRDFGKTLSSKGAQGDQTQKLYFL